MSGSSLDDRYNMLEKPEPLSVFHCSALPVSVMLPLAVLKLWRSSFVLSTHQFANRATRGWDEVNELIRCCYKMRSIETQ